MNESDVQSAFAQNLVYFIDAVVKKRTEADLPLIETMFKFMHNLDVFEKTYLTQLTNRVMTFEYSVEWEKKVAALFCEECSEKFQ